MKEMKSIASKEVSLVTYIVPQKKDKISDLRWILIGDDFSYPACFDKEDNFARINRLPTEKSSHTLLLDANYKIIAVGNPIKDLLCKKKYISILLAE